MSATGLAGMLAVMLLGVAGSASAAQTEARMSGISGDADQPRRHFRLRHPARLDPREAQRIYAIVAPALDAGYRSSGHPVAQAYQGWKRYNTAPYLSSTHGNHYLSNYANRQARSYARYERAGRFPIGAVIAKDSFSVTETGGILLGPLFVMEKMAAGFSPASGDWKYTLIQPDGTVFGETRGRGAQRVEYCIGCHLTVERQDHLYFVPRAYRIDRAD